MSDQIIGPAYRVETERLVIRCWNPPDAPLLNQAIEESLDHLREWMPWAMGEPTTLDEKIARLRLLRAQFDRDDTDYFYGIFNPEENMVLGGTGLHCRLTGNALEIGYWIHKKHTNQGLATETASALTKVAFEINQVDRVEIHHDPKNAASGAIPRKLGYTQEATLHNRITDPQGNLRDTTIWSLFRDQYPGSISSKHEITAFDAAARKIL